MTRVVEHDDVRNVLTPQEMDSIFDAHGLGEAARDLEAVMATFTPDAVHDVPGDPAGVLVGAAIAGRYEALFRDFETTGMEPIRRLYGPNFLVDECYYEALAVGQPFGIPGGNRPVRMRMLHVMEFADGLISNELVWLDVPAAIAQLTSFPAAPPPAE